MVLKNIAEFLPKAWDRKLFSEKREALRRCLEKVILHEDKIEVVVKAQNGPELKSIPIQLLQIGQKKLMLDGDGKEISPTRSNKDPALIKALVRAHKWEKALASGNQKSLGTIAKTEDLELKYVTRIYRLNFLAPKIKEAIIDGKQPQALTLSRLMPGVPLCWQEQERLYGF